MTLEELQNQVTTLQSVVETLENEVNNKREDAKYLEKLELVREYNALVSKKESLENKKKKQLLVDELDNSLIINKKI